MPQVFVALGSNINPVQRLAQAAQALRQHFADIHFSTCYRNAAFGFEGPDFYNVAAGFNTSLSIVELLAVLHAVEALCGRGREDPKWAPRAMDIDLLLYGEEVGEGPGYTLPRKDLTRRIYMLGPLAQIAPQWRYPPAGPTIGELWAAFPREGLALIPAELDLNRL